MREPKRPSCHRVMSTERQKYQPSKNICVTCRTRKVRCDGHRSTTGSCGNCERLGLPCLFPDSTASTRQKIELPRKRARNACSHCHGRKVRCSGQLPRCQRCQSLDLECAYPTRKRATSEHAITLPSKHHDEHPIPGNQASFLGQDSTQASEPLHDILSMNSETRTSHTDDVEVDSGCLQEYVTAELSLNSI